MQVLAGSQANARLVSIGPRSLKGFDRPVEVVSIESPEGSRGSMFSHVERHEQLGERLVGFLDYWESLPSLQKMRAEMFAELAPRPAEVICDIGCGTGAELIRIARVVGPEGTVIGIDPSSTMIEVCRDRAQREDVAVQLLARDGRDTGLPADGCDAVRMERVVQHVGNPPALLAEAKRITRPGGRVVIADTDWGSLMIHPGDRDLIRRFKTALETGPMAEPWAGRILHDTMLASDLENVTSRMYPIYAGLNAGRPPLSPMFDMFIEARLATRSEIDDLVADLAAAFERGGAVVAFTMFVASGHVPD
ncbi:MAG: methyltransferase domain-containing protein [Acidimicrobiia bacterium]|nr:methyltransferase domain-containing protein [Acidimicrobiia bacterium]